MGRLSLVVWFLIPVGLAAWHFGPGQKQLARDQAGELLRGAEAAEAEKDWAEAAILYGRAAADMPDEDHGQRNPDCNFFRRDRESETAKSWKGRSRSKSCWAF